MNNRPFEFNQAAPNRYIAHFYRECTVDQFLKIIDRSAKDRRKIRGEKKMKKEEFLKVISEKDNDQEVNKLIGEIEGHVFRYIKYGTRSNVFNLVETCYDDVKSMIVPETLKNYSVGRFMDLTYFVALCDLYFKNKSVLSERHDFEKALKNRRELAAIISFIVEEKHHVTLEDLCSHFEKDLTKNQIKDCVLRFDQYFSFLVKDKDRNKENAEIIESTKITVSHAGRRMYQFIRDNGCTYSPYAVDYYIYKNCSDILDFVGDVLDGEKDISDLDDLTIDLPKNQQRILKTKIKLLCGQEIITL